MKSTKARSGGRGLVLVAGAALVALALAMAAFSTSSSPTLSLGDPLLRARNLLDAGRISEASDLYREVATKDPRNADAIKGLAMCARESGDDETAVPLWQRYTALRPDDANGHRQLALAYQRTGRETEALSSAQTALALAPEGDAAMGQLVAKLLSDRQALGARPHPMSGWPAGGPDATWSAGPNAVRGLPAAHVPDPSRHFPTNTRNQ